MITIIAQSKKIARVISYVLNADKDYEGYYANRNYYVTWTYGHMVEIETPRGQPDYWQRNSSFPHLPDELPLAPAPQKIEDDTTPNQLNVVKRLLARSEKVIIALDPTMRGELIAKYILRYLGCELPVYRAVLNDLMCNTITQAAYKPVPYDPENLMAKIAEVSDKVNWLIDTNVQRALAFGVGMTAFPISRVAAPILGMIADREKRIKNFINRQWDEPTITFKDNSGEPVVVGVYSSCHETVFGAIKADDTVVVTNVYARYEMEQSPYLHSIHSLQLEAAEKFGLSPQKTYQVARTLYENRRISFPGPSNGGITRRKYEEVKEILMKLIDAPCFKRFKDGDFRPSFTYRAKNNDAVTHGIIVTGFPAVAMTEDEKKIYYLIVSRMFLALSKPFRTIDTDYTFQCGEETFHKQACVIEDMGWRKFDHSESEFAKPEINVKKGDKLPLMSVGKVGKTYVAPKPYTDATLMEAISEYEAWPLKADIAKSIGYLVNRGYVDRNILGEYSLTESGRVLHLLLGNSGLMNPATLHDFEDMIVRFGKYSEYGDITEEKILSAAKESTKILTKDLLSNDRLFNAETVAIKCPSCGKTVKVYGKVVRCTDKECDFTLFRQIEGVLINTREIRNLLASGVTSPIRGFIGANSRPFTGRIILETDGSPTVVPVNTK